MCGHFTQRKQSANLGRLDRIKEFLFPDGKTILNTKVTEVFDDSALNCQRK